jgi:hypothetical protein
MFRRFSLPLVSLLFWGLLNSCSNKEAVDLKLNLNPGDKFMSVIKVDQSIESSMFGKSMNVNQKISMFQEFEVKENPDSGLYSLNTSFSRIIMDQNMPMLGQDMKMKFDSDKMEEASEEGKMMGELMGKLIGQSYTIILDKKGKLISTDVQQLYKSLFKDSLAGDSNMPSDNLEQYITQLPDKPIKVGESFTNETKTSGEYPMNLNSKYTAKEINEKEVIFDVESTVGLGGEAKTLISKMEGKQTGIVKVSRATGLTIFSETKQEVVITMGAGAMTIPMKLNGTTTFELTQKTQ